MSAVREGFESGMLRGCREQRTLTGLAGLGSGRTPPHRPFPSRPPLRVATAGQQQPQPIMAQQPVRTTIAADDEDTVLARKLQAEWVLCAHAPGFLSLSSCA